MLLAGCGDRGERLIGAAGLAVRPCEQKRTQFTFCRIPRVLEAGPPHGLDDLLGSASYLG